MTQTHRFRGGRIAGLLLFITLFAAACGSAGETTSAPAVADIATEEEPTESSSARSPSSSSERPEPTEEEAEAAQLRYDRCLADEGVDVDTLFGDLDGEQAGVIDATEIDDFDAQFEAYEAANEACQPILEEVFGSFDLSPEEEAEFADAEAKFNQCMTDKGFAVDGNAISTDVDDFEALDSAADECGSVFEGSGIEFGIAEEQS